jgi:hypothetical protein
MHRISTWADFDRLTEVTGEQVEVLFDDHKGELSRRGYHDAGPGSTPIYRRMRKDIGHINVERMNAERFGNWETQEFY